MTLPELKEQLRQLQALHAAGTLDHDAFARARAEVERRMVERVMAGDTDHAAPAAPRVPARLWAALAAGIFVLAAAGYWWTGTPSAWDAAPATAQAADAAPHAADGQQIEAMVERLAARLKSQPDNAEGWAMLGRSLMVLGRQAEALPAYEKALALRPDDAALKAEVDEARAQGPAGASAQAMPPAAPDPAARISGTVSLAPALRSQVQPDDTVFVFARPVQGSRMPVAIVRRQVRDLPFEFTLDDSSAMSPAQKLSGLQQATVVARISKSGNAAPQPGDLVAELTPVALGSRGVKLEIARTTSR
ncbi:MAG: c-type cytochrome biogenesis protein CcmI [Pseudomonadota bacterium]